MTNLLAAIIYVILIAIVVITLFFAYLRDRTKLVTKNLIRLGVIVVGWQVFAVLYFLISNEAIALWTYTAKLVFAAFAPVQLLLLCVNFYSATYSRKASLLFWCLCIIPTITAILAITAPFHTLLRAEIYFVQFEPLRVLHNERGVWFWVHTGYSYSLMILSVIFILFKHLTLPEGFRMPSMLVSIGSIIALLSSLFVVFTPYSKNIDLTLVSLSIAIVFTYAGITISDGSSLLVQAFDNIFTYIKDYIFILNTKNIIIEMNPAARNWLHLLGFSEEMSSFDEITEKLVFLSESSSDSNVADGRDYQLMIGQQLSHYNLNQRPIIDQTGRTLGTFAIFTDITRHKLLVERIERSAGIDPLTKLGNRRSYEQALEALDEQSSLPLSVILGDVDHLKLVNDSGGHAAGDDLLRTIAQILSSACPNDARVYRIGGDEFVVLLPCTPTASAEAIVMTIHEIIAQNNGPSPYNFSISLGVATKETEEQSLLECIAQADRTMYSNKQNERRVVRESST